MSERSIVPCGSCWLCCRHPPIALHPERGDDPAQYLTMKTVNPLDGQTIDALQHKDNGECVYLDERGKCSIHDRAPAVCREFDCRRLYQSFTRTERRAAVASGLFPEEVLNRGRELIRRPSDHPVPTGHPTRLVEAVCGQTNEVVNSSAITAVGPKDSPQRQARTGHHH